ncbi:MAG: hypothetical protein IPN42_08015 [Methylococcaceae bacterium]|nr:hypothetical protein [Methylococcaceae bacterium]
MNKKELQMSNIDAPAESLDSENNFRLIVHIGAGKTGTSSIQNAMRNHQEVLREYGFWYLGIMLEHAPVKLYSWQQTGAFEQLRSLSESEITDQILNVMHDSLPKIKAAGCNTAIWSNESLFSRPEAHKSIIKALEIMSEEGCKIDVIVYVRRHDAWMKSAYTQWGIQHKTYNGPLVNFSTWASRNPPCFMNNLRKWMAGTGFNCLVRNFDAVSDVVEDFLSVSGMPLERIEHRRINESPSTEELLLRALFNNQIQESALPYEFDRVMSAKKSVFDRSATTFLTHYLPTAADLEKVADDNAEDRAEVNEVLIANGQKPLETKPLNSKSKEIDVGKIVSALFEMLAYQARKIENLESKVDKLTKNN